MPCPVDCVEDAWSPLSFDDAECSLTCGGGTKTRTRTVHPDTIAWGGKACGATASYKDCNTQPCPVDCTIGAWEDFGQCTRSDGQSPVSIRMHS